MKLLLWNYIWQINLPKNTGNKNEMNSIEKETKLLFLGS